MSALPRTLAWEALAPEWQRVELLAVCAGQSRGGRTLAEDVVREIERLQRAVRDLRRAGGWSHLGARAASSLELDVLACVAAPEIEPRLGSLYHALQPVSPQPHASIALIHDLLALNAVETQSVSTLVAPGGALEQRGWLLHGVADLFEPLRPAPGLAARILGLPWQAPAPPGAVSVQDPGRLADLVLPPESLQLLREFVLWIRHRDQVVTQWGGMFCGGPVALFSGPSGTGKSYAAAAVAGELGWPLYRVDLGRLVSKYIGETEKNLNRLFDAAHGQRMVLLIDEADSLFGRRGEVRDARDRYANLEVSHLLARIERHEGPCILTTNLRSHIDAAFLRRFQAVVEFPRPDVAARAELWARLLPPRAPRAADLDPTRLGHAVVLSGGSIRNAALHAAYLAAGAGTALSLRHAALAAWREIQKLSPTPSLADLGELRALLDN